MLLYSALKIYGGRHIEKFRLVNFEFLDMRATTRFSMLYIYLFTYLYLDPCSASYFRSCGDCNALSSSACLYIYSYQATTLRHFFSDSKTSWFSLFFDCRRSAPFINLFTRQTGRREGVIASRANLIGQKHFSLPEVILLARSIPKIPV